MELQYKPSGDYFIPDLKLMEEEPQPLTKYGLLRYQYLKEHLPTTFSWMLMMEELRPHLRQIQEEAETLKKKLMENRLAQTPPPNRQTDPLGWAMHMMAVDEEVDQIVLAQVVFQ